MTFDLARARRETPGCEHVLHFNNAGAGLMPQPVLDATLQHLQLEAQIGGYEAEARASATIARVYDSTARLLGCHRDEIALMDSATRAWDMAFYAIPFRPGDRILTGKAEYASNVIAMLQVARRTAVEIDVVPDDDYGQISVEALRARIDDRVRLIALTHVPTSGGLVNPAEAVGKVAREAGILYLLDACQSVGQMPVDVETIGCDLLSATGRKFLRGPRGTGFLYVRKAIMDRLEPPFLDMLAAEWTAHDRYEVRSDARRFETWEADYAVRIGLGTAIDYALAWGLDAIAARVTGLAESLRAQLAALPGVTVQDRGRERCGIVTFTVSSLSPEEIRRRLGEQNINIWVSTQSATRFDLEARGLDKLARASVHYYNSEEEVTRFVAALRALTP